VPRDIPNPHELAAIFRTKFTVAPSANDAEEEGNEDEEDDEDEGQENEGSNVVDAHDGISPQPYSEWDDKQKTMWKMFLFELIPFGNKEWANAVKKAKKTKMRISKKLIEDTLHTSDFAFVLVVLQHKQERWREAFQSSQERTKGVTEGQCKLFYKTKDYNAWGELYAQWRANPQWWTWMTKCQMDYFGIEDDTAVMNDVSVSKKGKKSKRGNSEDDDNEPLAKTWAS